MRKYIYILALLCGSASAVVPVRQCSATALTTTSCNITVAAHHLVTTLLATQGDVDSLTYSDTLGNSFAQVPFLGCFPGGNVCNPGVGMAQSYSITFAAQSNVLFYISTGAFSGSVTFTVSGHAGNDLLIHTYEYDQDLIGVDVGTQTGTTITTTGANDLIIVMTGDSGVTTCSLITPTSGFTLEFSQNISCKSYSDRINLTPGTYTYKTTLTGSAAPGWSAMAFGVAPFVSSAVRHARRLY